jgi:putative transcriptional regulator
LRKAHKAVERLSAGDVVALEWAATDSASLAAKFGDLGVGAFAVQMPAVDPRKIRERFHLTQDEFADHFLLSVDTVRNWEQRRNKPDPTTQLLLKVMEDYPQVLEAILCNATVFHTGAYRIAVNSVAFQTQMASQTLLGLMEFAGRFVADAPEFRRLNASFNSYVDVRAHTWVVAPRRAAIP